MTLIHVPQHIIDQINKDAAQNGFTSKRVDAKNSRWLHVQHALDLARAAKQSRIFIPIEATHNQKI